MVRPLLLLLISALCAACAGSSRPAAEATLSGEMDPKPTGETAVFECADGDSDVEFTVRTGPGEVALWLPERFQGRSGGTYLVLGQVRAASGAKYEGGGVTVWTKGDAALLEVDGQTFTGCRENPQRSVWEDAERSGVDFRAVGQEPGWHLDICEGERIRFVYAYGEREATTPAPAPTVADGRTVYRAESEAHTLIVTITGEPCSDVMSGERFEHAVTVELDGEPYRGCGRSLP